jgi:hypothetical protein
MIMDGILLVAVVAVAGAVSVWLIRRSATPPSEPVQAIPPRQVNLPLDLQHRLRTAAAQGYTDQAISELRRHARLPSHEAAAVVHALVAGRVFPTPEAAPSAPRKSGRDITIDAELLIHLRELMQDPANRPAAVQLLRRRTGMGESAARRFLDAL